MVQSIRAFLNRPIAEDFSFNHNLRLSLQAGLYVFLFLSLLNMRVFSWGQLGGTALVSAGCSVASLFANWFIPSLATGWYDEDRWTVGKHIVHTLFVLFCISVMNQLLLTLTDSGKPAFWQMYLYVTLIGFFPITLGLLLAERRRLKRNAEKAGVVNAQLSNLPTPQPAHADSPSTVPIVLSSDNDKDKLTLQPDQLIYIESVGNYIEVHWLNLGTPQKTLLRNTLKGAEATLREYPQFFRCHRAFIVNLKAVNRTEGNSRGYQLTLTGAAAGIPVSRSYLESFDERMQRLYNTLSYSEKG